MKKIFYVSYGTAVDEGYVERKFAELDYIQVQWLERNKPGFQMVFERYYTVEERLTNYLIASVSYLDRNRILHRLDGPAWIHLGPLNSELALEFILSQIRPKIGLLAQKYIKWYVDGVEVSCLSGSQPDENPNFLDFIQKNPIYAKELLLLAHHAGELTKHSLNTIDIVTGLL